MNYLKGVENIAEFIGFCTKPCCILLRFYKEGSLEMLISSGKTIKPKLMLSLLKDISNGISEMHSREIVHLDILLKLDGKRLCAVLTDFGISHVVSHKLLLVKEFRVANMKGVSLVYASPESFARFKSRNIQKPAVVKASDVYSFACVIYEFANKKAPWFP
jgi:serine/threonine protein kinase